MDEHSEESIVCFLIGVVAKKKESIIVIVI